MASISDYKKQHPEYRNIPDLQLAEIMYEKAYKGKISETEFYKLAFPEIADERVEEYVPLEGLDYLEGRGISLPKDDFFKPTTSEIAKSAGVSVNDPADIKSRFGGSLGYNEEQKRLAIQNSLSKIYKQDIEVRTGPQTGELEYFNPKTQSYALVDKPGMDFGDFGDIGGDSLVIGADIAGTIVGTIFTTPVGGLATGAIAAGAAEYYRLKWGQEHYGVNLDLADNQLLHEAFKTAGISGAAGFIGIGGVKLIKSINNVVKGRSFSSVDEGVESLKSAKALEAEKVAKDINIKLEDAGINSKLKYTLAEATDEKDLLAIQSAFEEKRVLGKVGEFREFGKEQAKSLNEYFGLMKAKFGVNAGSTYDTGKLISEVTENRNKDAVKNLIKKQKASDELLTKKVFNLPDGSSKVTGVEFRSIVKDLGDAYKSDAKLASKELDKASGLKLIDTDEIAKAVTKLSAKEQKSLIEVAKIEGIFKPGIYDDLLSKNSKMLLSDARETMSVLSKRIREKQIGLAAGETPDVGKLMFLKSAFTDQIKKNAGKEYLDELQKFNDLVITNKELLNNDIISKLTKIEIGSILKVADEDIFETTFKKGIGSGKAAAEVYEVISKSPEALNAYKNSIFNKYRSEVLDPITNKPSLVKHNSFIKNYEKPLRTFFNDAEYNKISRIGGLQRNIEKTNKLFTQTQKELSKSFEGKLFNTSPEEIFKKIYGPGNIGQVRTLKNILQKNPEVFKKFQRDVLTDLNEKVFKLDKKFTLGRVLDADAFNKYLNGGGGEAGHRAVLKEIFGNEYVKNLDTLNQALQIANRSAATAQQGVVASAFTDIIRARVGQFTVAGRLLTAFRRIFTAASNRMIARALLNPDSLKDLIALKKLPKKSKAAAAILAKLGGSVFMVQDDLPTQPSKETVIEQDIETTDDQVSSLLNEGEGADDGGQMAAMPLVDTPSLVVPNVNPNLFAKAPTGIMSMDRGLTPTESALLSPEEQQIRLRSRGIA
jgi:hypothetical protein